MTFKPMKVQFDSSDEVLTWPGSPILLNGGLNLVDREWKLANNQTVKAVNMWFNNGELGSRPGQQYLVDGITVEIPCYAAYKVPYQGYIIKHCGTKLYKQDPETGATTQIYTGMNTSKGVFFKSNSKLYYKQPGKYVAISSNLVVSDVVPYIPTVIINRTYSGGGNTNEQYNRVGTGFINAFITDGTHATFPLTDTNLDATASVGSNDGGATWTLLEGTNFTINRTTGSVTFTSTPPSATNTYRIKAYKTVQSDIDSILNCKNAMPFGGQNDNRVFALRNGTGYYYWTGISSAGIDPSYWPYNNYNIIGNPDEDITGVGKHYDTLTLHKSSGEIYGVTYTWNGTVGVFNSFPINEQYGCDCPDSMQNINNSLVWLNSRYGPCILLRTDVGSQRNAFPIGRNINPRLLSEANLTSATSIDFSGHYWLCVNDKVYAWNYFISPYVDTGNPDLSAKQLSWWYFTNINSSCFIINNYTLLYGSRTTGKVAQFIPSFSDFGLSYERTYRIPLRDLGGSIYEFDVLTMWVDIRVDTRTKISMTYIMNGENDLETESATIDVGSFSYSGFSYSTFTYNVVGSRNTYVFEPQEKKIDLFGVEFTNSELYRDMNISNVEIAYRLGKKKR